MRARLPPSATALNPLQSLIARRWRPQWVCQSCRRQQPQWQRTAQRSLATTTTTTTTPPSSTTAEPRKPYYVTTPIFYVNAAPHIGHMYTMLLADVLKRWHALKGHQSILVTGTDEHGMKIQQAASKANADPQAFCDKGAAVFKDLAAKIGIDYDHFIRTTDKHHREGVEYAWQVLESKGLIYESKHEGWYSVSDETFYPQSAVHMIVDPPTGRKTMVSTETGKEVEWTSERNYHFKLSAFRQPLLDWYASHPDWILPTSRMSDIVSQVSSSLGDLSISRPVSRLTWGIRVPTDSSQTIYVWLDALLNYATALGYPFPPTPSLHTTGFPPDVQVIGKDITRFHCIYWPAILMALDLPLPKQILTHAHWTLGRQKMAKSTGNVVNPFFALDRFGPSALRWYLLHEGGIAQDADYDNTFVIEKYKKFLQGGLGNLSGRIMRTKKWDVPRAIKRYAHPNHAFDSEDAPFPAVSEESDMHGRRFYGRIRALPSQVSAHMDAANPPLALKTLFTAVTNANAYLQHTAPWTLATQLQTLAADTTGQQIHEATQRGEGPEDLEGMIDRCVYLNAETLRLVGIMLRAFLPERAEKLLDMLGVEQGRRGWEWCVVGKDESYGVPVGGSGKEVLFPLLSSDF